MHEVTLRLECAKPGIVAKSMQADIKNSQDSQTTIEAGNGFVTIRIKSEKLSHLKAIVNAYISTVGMLNAVEELK